MSAKLPSVATVDVRLHGEPVGTLARTSEGLAAFSYTSEWLASGFSISPFDLPLENRVFIADGDPSKGFSAYSTTASPTDGGACSLTGPSRKPA